MKYYKIQDETLSGIADAIREKCGTAESYSPGQMAEAIGGIQTGAALNIAYGATAPEDTSKLWVKTTEPTQVRVTAKVTAANEELNTYIAALPEKRIYAASAAVGTRIYLFGGSSNATPNDLDSIRVFDTETKTISSLDVTLPKALYHTSAAAVGTKIYLFGGRDADDTVQNSIHVFDTETNTISTLDVTMVAESYGSSAVAVGTKIYVFGGAYIYNKKVRVLSYVHMFDTELGEIFRLNVRIPTAQRHMAAAAAGTKIYLLGGYYQYDSEPSVYRDTIYAFDTETYTFSTLSTTLPNPLYFMAAAAAGTKIYLFGGYTGTTTMSTEIISFDMETHAVSTLDGTMLGNTYGGAAAAVGTKIYLLGGYSGNGYDLGIHEFVTQVPLAENTLLIEASYTDNSVALLTGVELGIANVYVGNAQGLAEKVAAAVYKDGAWVEI